MMLKIFFLLFISQIILGQVQTGERIDTSDFTKRNDIPEFSKLINNSVKLDNNFSKIKTPLHSIQYYNHNYFTYTENLDFFLNKNLYDPIRNLYIPQKSNDLIKSLLGAAQLTAVGFLAYKHISKYGFIKPKDE